MSIQFTDNSVQVKAAINDALIAALHECAGELASQAKRNSRVGKVAGGKTKNSWDYKIENDYEQATAYVGNTEENAVWEEYGTGEYALKGNGRKGKWYVHIGNGKNDMSEKVAKAYGFKIVHGKGGEKYAETSGKKPSRALNKAYTSSKTKIENRLKSAVKGATE